MKQIDVPADTSPSELLNRARACRGAGGDVRRCEALAERAIHGALDNHEPETAYHAAACAGRMRIGRGEAEVALGHYRQALEIAREHLPPSWLGPAYHDLYITARECGCSLAAKRYSGTAADLYRSFGGEKGTSLLAALYADVASEGAERYPDCRERAGWAVDAWRKAEGRYVLPLYAYNGHAQQMRWAASLNDGGGYINAVERAEHVRLYLLPDGEHVARTLVHMAGSALLARDFVRALDWAHTAEALAHQRNELRIETEARAVLSAALAEAAQVPA